MDALFEAIYDKLTTAGNLNTAVGGRIYLHNSPTGSALPYLVYQHISDDTDFNFTSTFDTFRIQCSIFSSSVGQGTSQVLSIYNYLTALMDDCTLSVTGYQFLNCERQFANLSKDADQDIWHYAVDYEILLRKDS